MSYKNRKPCDDLNNAAQPGDFSRYTGDDKENRQIRKENEATANMTDEKGFIQAAIRQQLG
jgi:hypothetical protein